MKSILVFFFFTLIAGSLGQTANTCSQAVAFCGASELLAGTVGQGEVGPNYGCLQEEPAPAWFYFQIASGNNITIDFSNSNNQDIDYAIWGPFSSMDCGQILSGSIGPISCSFVDDTSERAVLTTVQPGDFFIMMVTNFETTETIIRVTVTQTFTNGDLNCSIVSPSPSRTPSISPSNSLSNTPTPSVSVTSSQTPSRSRNDGDVCSDREAFCGFSEFLPGIVGQGQPGPNYGCLDNRPAPRWFYFQIAQGNNITIDFTNSQDVDIDYAIWGPFSSPDCGLIETGTIAPISCSFDRQASERAILTSVNVGEFYIMVITNFDRRETVVRTRVSFENTNGDLNCGIVTPSNTPSISITPSRSDSNSVTPTRSLSNSMSLTNTASATRSDTASVSLTPSTSATRTPTRTPTRSTTPSPTSRRSRSPTSTTTPTVSDSRTPRASRSNTRTPSSSRTPTRSPTASRSFNATDIPRTTGVRTTGSRTTGVENRTTGLRTTGVQVARTTGVVARTTGNVARTTGTVTPSTTPSEIIASSPAFSLSPFFSLIFVVLAAALTVLSVA